MSRLSWYWNSARAPRASRTMSCPLPATWKGRWPSPGRNRPRWHRRGRVVRQRRHGVRSVEGRRAAGHHRAGRVAQRQRRPVPVDAHQLPVIGGQREAGAHRTPLQPVAAPLLHRAPRQVGVHIDTGHQTAGETEPLGDLVVVDLVVRVDRRVERHELMGCHFRNLAPDRPPVPRLGVAAPDGRYCRLS